MARALALREDNALESSAPPLSREQVVARYRQLREISARHHHEILKHISDDTLLRQARRLGLAHGNTLLLDDMDELTYAFDLAIHAAAPGRSRAIDRYAKSARFPARSDEALVLAAMCNARFCILAIKRRHETAGLIATDLFRRAEIWLVDIGLESSMPDGAVMATRLFTPERFAMTAGVNVPFNLDMVPDLSAALPRRLSKEVIAAAIDDRRFAEAIYSLALADGIADRVCYRDPFDDV
jgi:hypothetical protein